MWFLSYRRVGSGRTGVLQGSRQLLPHPTLTHILPFSCQVPLAAPPSTDSPLHGQASLPGAVLVDGEDVDLPWIGAEGVNVSRASSTFLLLRWPGAWVLWGVADPAAYITLDPRHAYQVCQEASECLG